MGPRRPDHAADASPTDGASAPERSEAADTDAALTGLRRHARQLVAELAGPVRRLRLRAGDTELEVEWHHPAEPGAGGPVVAGPAAVAGSGHEPAGAAGAAAAPPVTPPLPVAPETRTTVRSPMVGTFYRAPEPGAAPFVAVGDLVRPGQIVGIVEAMKLMNEITADRAGRVAEVLAVDGQPVEYDQPLVALDPT
ncbi:acetyl-CoA carboxylase biotin carboxyl carrier protein [Micromonospora sp. NPDC051296]|uniref:acetyl-CoA carboxylase biotin carboxyl carrier protein n=1 Tax=Micromonospora sp. NPDC051296 TaxID=3155046 RepID=UPI003413E64A